MKTQLYCDQVHAVLDIKLVCETDVVYLIPYDSLKSL